MTKIESKKVLVNAPASEVYTFLCNMNNVRELLPADAISEWKSDEHSCSFKIQGAYTIGLVFSEGMPHSKIIYSGSDNAPFPFTLTAFLSEKEGKIEVYQLCEAKLNAFLEMLVKGPLKNLFDYMATKLEAKYA